MLFRSDEYSPGASVKTDAEIEQFVRAKCETIYHPVGTCKMGPATDANAVVDNQGRVYGLEGLRVVDASIMPEIIRGHTHAPSVVIGERAAHLISNK